MKILIFAFILLMTTPIFSQMPPLETGVAQSLAKWRSENYSDVSYKLNITLEKSAPLMKGEIEIRVKLTDEGAKSPLVIDWRTTQFESDKDKPYANVVAVNDAVDFRTQINKEHLLIPNGLLKTGENVIKIQFASPVKTSGSAITRYIDKEDGGEYIYSLFVPSDASTALPVFDQPDLKAKFSLSLTMPPGWKAISNTNSLTNPRATEFGGRSLRTINFVNFDQTQPISTYVFAFSAGEFADFSDKYAEMENGLIDIPDDSDVPNDKKQPLKKFITPKIYVRKSQAKKFEFHAAEVFRLNREAVKFYESYFDYKFPFPKYDLVLIPEFPFGGMEHAGATFLREASVIFPTEPTKNDYVSRATLIFHETAHQWFGDLVTMQWFDDLWLKEGFATFMGYKAMEKIMPEYNAWKIFYERTKQTAYLTDSTKGTTAIYQEIPNLSAAKSAYGNIVYNKAPSFLRQAEFYLGEDKFQIAVRALLKKHQFANAGWQDLVSEFETAGKQDLKDWANGWVKKRGMPKVTTIKRDVHEYEKLGQPHDTLTKVYLQQKDSLDEKGLWQMQTNVLIRFENGATETKKITLLNNETLVDGYWSLIYKNPKANKNADLIFPNYQDYGYGTFLLDARSQQYILENIQNEKDDFLRTMMWGSLWDSVRESELAPKDYVELVIKNINTETDESTIQTLLGRCSTAMNYYLSDTQRDELAPKLETILIDKIKNSATLGQRITFYRSFLSIASSENARTILKAILNGKFEIKDLKLKTKDKFDIVTKLLILSDKDAQNLLADLEKTETSDEAKRYAYAAKAGIGTAENKAKFWNDFVNNKEISESYIESAFGVWNSSKHADLTLPYLEKALAELPNLKKNRKIFFVNGWLGSFIGGQKSAAASNLINKFLADNPNLDKDLRLKILENADGLERAVKIRAKYEKN